MAANQRSQIAQFVATFMARRHFFLYSSLLLALLFLSLAEANPSKQKNKAVDKSDEATEQKHPILGAADDEVQTCQVRVQVVKKVTGKCVRLHGGNMACQTDDYLDPVNEDCIFA